MISFTAADGGGRAFEDFHFPALRFRVTRIHAKQFAGEERGFVSSGAGADFDDHVFIVVGIFWQQQRFQVLFHFHFTIFEEVFLVVGHLLHFRIVGFEQHLLHAGQALFDFFPFAIFADHFGEFGMGASELLEARGIGLDFGRGELLRQFFVARFDVVEFLVQR